MLSCDCSAASLVTMSRSSIGAGSCCTGRRKPPTYGSRPSTARPFSTMAEFRSDIRLNGSIETAMISVDAMTAPRFRRRGLLTRGIARAFTEWQAHGIAFTLGLPNARWGSRTAAAGWQNLFPLQWAIRPFRPEVFAARRFGMPWLRRSTIFIAAFGAVGCRSSAQRPAYRVSTRSREPIAPSTACGTAVGRTRPFSMVRDSAWVQWRFLSSPTSQLPRRGGAPRRCRVRIPRDPHREDAAQDVGVSRRARRAGLRRAAQDSLLAEAIATADDAGADVLAALAVPGTRFHRRFAEPVSFLALPSAFTSYRLRRSCRWTDCGRPENWQLSGAEFDVL